MEGETKIEQLISNIKEYAETRFDATVLNIQDKTSDVLASIASAAIVGILSIFIILFITVGAALWIGQVLHNPSFGFFCIAGFYVLVAIIVAVNRDKWIKLPIINGLLKKINFHEED